MRRPTARQGALLFTVSSLVLGSAQVAHAQAARSAANAGGAATIEELVVTAEKREQNLQSVPVTVTAVAPELLQRAGVKDFINIQKIAPNVNTTQAAGQTAVQIRGVVTGSHDPTDESPNAVHIDGNYIARQNVINGLFYDIERLEILLGPQGTLYGRNSAGGAINIITNKPTFEYGGQGSAEFGSYNLQRFEGAINIPITDTIAVRAAGVSYTHDGYFNNGTNDANQHGIRVEGLWRPDDRQQLMLTADMEKFAPKGVGDNILESFPGAKFPVQPHQDNRGVPSSSMCTLGAPVFNVGCTPGQPAGFYGDQLRSFTDIETQAASLQYDYRFDIGTLTLQYAHRRMSQKVQNYGGGGLTNIPEVSNTDTAELRLTSASTKPLQYVVGLAFFQEFATGAQQTYFDITSPNFGTIAKLHDAAHSFALFGQLTYTPTSLDKLHIILGGRGNYDQRKGDSVIINNAVGTVFPQLGIHHDWKNFSYKAGLQYDLTPQNMVFATASTGYKSGGIAFGAFPVVPPETNIAYELGSKNRFFENRLQVNGDIFYYKFKNPEFLQAATTVFNGRTIGTLEIVTADYQEMFGVEMDSIFQVTPDDRIFANANYLHARVHNLDLSRPELHILGGLSLHDTPLPQAPDWTGRAGYTHSWDALRGRFDATASVFFINDHPIAYPSAFTGLAAGNPLLGTAVQAQSPSAVTLDLSLRYAPDDAKWSVTAYVNNVNDDFYYVQGNRVTSGVSNLFNTLIGVPSDPRTYGVILTAKF